VTKILILTGAGASFGAGSTFPYNPPLGRNLYSELKSFAPQIMSQISQVVGEENKEDFETKMHEVWDSRKINGVVLNSVIASYFSMFRPNSNGNNFVELFRKLNGENISYVYSTLNYDCIAELAASSIGMTVNYRIDNMLSDDFDVLKLHGSCNFLLGGMTGPLGGLSMPMMNGGIDGPIDVVQPNQVQTLIQNRPAGPCMSFYMKNKPTSVGLSTIKAIQSKWKDILKDSDSFSSHVRI